MMEARELRIGNLLKSANSERVFSVTIEDLVIIEAGSKCRPIQLTEEWLLKLGFFNIEENPIRYFLKHDEVIILAYDIDDCCVRVSDSWEFGKRKFVHEIQNLYFALTGKELDIC